MKKINALTMGAAVLTSALLFSPQQAIAAEKTLNIGMFWLPSDINPTTKWNGWGLARLGIGENLVQVDENMEFKPVIAESWTKVDDKTTVFNIREGITFHDGSKVTADAVKKSIENALKVSGRKNVKFPVESITAEGQKLTIKTSKPYAILINNLSDPVFTIVKGFEKEGFANKPIATGPFSVDKFEAGKGVSLSKYDGYWGGAVNIDKVKAVLIKDASTRAMALQSGEVDLVTQIEPNDLKMLEKENKFTIQKGPNARIFMIRLNTQKEYMKNIDFRKAISHAIDQESIVKNIAKGYPAKGPFPPMYDFSYNGETPYKFNISKAKELLDKAKIVDSDGDGFREFDGKNITLKYISRASHGTTAKNIGVAVQSSLKEIGLKVEAVQVESFGDILKKGEFDLVWERWTAAPGNDPEYFLKSSFQGDSIGNRGKYSNAKFDKVIAKLSDSLDKKERNALSQDAIKIILQDVPALFMYHGEGNIITTKKVKGVVRFPSEIYFIDSRISID